jgi:hypothetical protein
MPSPAPETKASPEALRAALFEAWLGLNYAYDQLNERDKSTDRDAAIMTPIFDAIRKLTPGIFSIEVYPTLGMRHLEPIGQCSSCLQPINWHEHCEKLPSGNLIHAPKCPAKGGK